MVNFIDCGRTEFIKQTKNKRLFCFGAGKYLQHFIDSNYGVDVEAIIDNFRYKDETPILIGDKSVSVISARNVLFISLFALIGVILGAVTLITFLSSPCLL